MKWDKKQKELFKYLTDWVTDEETAGRIVNGGQTGFLYGNGGYYPYTERTEFVTEQIELGTVEIEDAGLSQKYLIGTEA